MQQREILKAQDLISSLRFDTLHITYQVSFNLHSSSTRAVGKLGTFRFPTGDYIYTGSARKNMRQRLERHLSKHKKPRWHIDYLLTLKEATVTRIEIFTRSECRVNADTSGAIIAPGFGASDCRSHCVSHLKFLGTRRLTPGYKART